MKNDAPIVARPKPFLVSVDKGKNYAWCACGRSKTQPFCDGAHKGTALEPVLFTAEKTEDLLLCGCKQTKSAPYCDGAHNNLEDIYEKASLAEIDAMKNARTIPRDKDAYGKAMLDGGAYVLTPDMKAAERENTLSILPLITSSDGANHLSFFQIDAEAGNSPWRRHEHGDAVLFIVFGEGDVNIDGERFKAGPEIGIFVRKGEAFRFEAADAMCIMMAVCPKSEPDWPDEPAAPFDRQFPGRSVAVDHAKRNTMADRFYQILVGQEIGSTEVTQFIGEVPKSRAAFHHHLYEEAIVILSGEGVMWTETKRAPVKPGDVIFLPARQGHSLECTVNEGLRLMGVFYPAGSPAINY